MNRLRHRKSPVRALLVLDDSLFCSVVEVALASLDHLEVAIAESGADAGRRAAAGEVDVVVLDGDAGELPGVLREIERLAAASDDLRIVVLAAAGDLGVIEQLLDAGATSVVSKAVYPSDLGAVIRQAARGAVFHRPGPAATVVADRPPLTDLPLTPREVEILRLVAEGVGNRGIAERLWVTEQTVKFHLSNIYRKLRVANRTQAAAIAQRYELG
jgi:DNA-binding NarL/FixJ family response regulator